MKKLITVFIFPLISFFAKAQSIERLDTANGFKYYKIGMSCSQLKNVVERSRNKGNGTESIFYESTDKSIYTYLGTPLKNVGIICENGKVVYITLYTNNEMNVAKNFILYQKMYSTFGSASDSLNKGLISYRFWRGENIILSLKGIFDNSPPGMTGFSRIEIYSKSQIFDTKTDF
jgi:hypothetical protein